MSEYIEREAAIEKLNELCGRVCQYSKAQRKYMCGACPLGDAFTVIEDDIPAADVRPVPEGGIGEMSDGYHTFNGLYYQRMILFAALVKQNKGKAWKSWRHEDGELCFGGGWFIVGIDTPEGSYTYHYEDKDWDLFDCTELPVAKHWDGHTEKDVTRLMSLDVRPVEWIPVTERLPEDGTLLGKLICDSEGHIRIATQFARIGLKDKWVYTDLIDMVKFLAEEVSEPISEWEDCTHITHWMPLPNLPAEENANG